MNLRPSRETVAVALVALVVLSMTGGAASLLVALSGPSYETTNVTYATNSGVNATLQGNYNVTSGNPFADDQTIEFVTNKGNATVSGSGPANVTLTQLTGTETRATNLDVTSNALTINPEDKQKVTVSGDTSDLHVRAMALDDGTQDFYYKGASGTTTLTINDLPFNTGIVAIDTATGNTLDKKVTDGTGAVTLELDNSEHTVKLQESDTGVPELTNADPTGPQSTTPSELSINVSDSDFPNDEVNVTMVLDGTVVKETNVTSNGTVTYALNNVAPGDHTWSVAAVDSFDNRREANLSFSTPDNLTIYNATAPNELVNNTEVTAVFYSGGNEVFNKSTTDGKISLEGLPTSTDLVVKASAENYTSRSIVIEDLAVQHSVFLLQENVSTNEVRFKVDDATGEFDTKDTQVIVKKPITQSGSTKWQVVAAGEVGATGFTTVLENGKDYRLVVKNGDDDTRKMGSYTSTVSETVILEIDDAIVDVVPDNEPLGWDASYDNSSGSPVVKWEYADTEDLTTDLTLTICEYENCSANTIVDTSFTGTYGNASFTQPLTDAQKEKTWVVKWTAERNGQEISGRRIVGPHGGPGIPLDGLWKNTAAVGLIVFVGGLSGSARPAIGAAVTAALGGILWYIGWLPPAIGGGAVALAFGMAFVLNVRRGV